MKIKKIVEDILSLIGKSTEDMLSPRSGILLSEVIEGLILFPSMKEISSVFDKTEDAFENLIRRNLRPLFPEKTSNTSWDNYLLDLANLRKCSCCNELKGLNMFCKATGTNSSLCKECDCLKSKEYRNNNLQDCKDRSANHYKNNKSDYLARNANRRALKLKATPSLANLDLIKEIYRACPEGYHVDHVVPLQGELVCGLHVESNLQHLLAKDNLQKHNKFTGE